SYRCNMLSENGDILFPADIVAESLAAAIQHASNIRRMSNEGTAYSRQVYAFKVWSDNGRLYPQEGHC
ncbi:MAG TPA: hypothetical protein VE109_05330, partial [Acidobacteriaceae bacterium]|nr:hypothetical protein [Acidobacteriaceae bacterium]